MELWNHRSSEPILKSGKERCRGPNVTGTESKVDWEGTVLSVQPRIRLSRSFDQRSHSYLGYVLQVSGNLDGEPKDFIVALGKGAQEKHRLRAGDGRTVRIVERGSFGDGGERGVPGFSVQDRWPRTEGD